MYDEFGEFEYGKYDIKFYKDDNYTEEQKREMEEEVAKMLEGTGKTSIEELTALDMRPYCSIVDCPICRACKNEVINEESNWGRVNNCKAYGTAPDKYFYNSEDKSCPHFIGNKESSYYEVIKNILNLPDDED